MNKQTRISKIAEIMDREDGSHGGVEIPWEDALKLMPVYKIPLNLLVYNKYNGRILSRTKSLESQGTQINTETNEGRKLIEKLLLDSNPTRNKQTQESIEKIGQEKVGIITRDGIIIDGNRRAMLLNSSKFKKYDYFKTVVLDVTLDENPIEIEKLETTYQMGEDEKLAYNPIEKYIKAKGLNQRGVAIDKIASWMGESKSTIEEYLEVMETMDSYLDYLGYNGIYTQLDGREDHFINLTKQLGYFYGEQSQKAFDGYKDDDVDDLKLISYDYIRIKYEGKDFRTIAYGLRENHIFGDKTIWKSFRDFHFQHVKPLQDGESKINFNAENLEAYLNDRDNKFFNNSKDEKGKSFFDENIDLQRQKIRYRKSRNEPLKLVTDAIGALKAIDQTHSAFSARSVMEQVEAINQKTATMLGSTSPERLLTQVIQMLNSIKCECGHSTKKSLIEKIKEVEKIARRIGKEIEKA